jgi:hypothetical protein
VSKKRGRQGEGGGRPRKQGPGTAAGRSIAQQVDQYLVSDIPMDEDSPQMPALGLKGDELEAYLEMKGDIVGAAQEEEDRKKTRTHS